MSRAALAMTRVAASGQEQAAAPDPKTTGRLSPHAPELLAISDSYRPVGQRLGPHISPGRLAKPHGTPSSLRAQDWA